MTSHSWSLKGEDAKLMNIWFTNSTSLMTAITSFGDAFSSEIQGSVTSKLFIEFLDELKRFIKDRLGTSIQKWLNIFDNASIHRSEGLHCTKQLKLCIHSDLFTWTSSDRKTFLNIEESCYEEYHWTTSKLERKESKRHPQWFDTSDFIQKRTKFMEDVYSWDNQKFGWFKRITLKILI